LKTFAAGRPAGGEQQRLVRSEIDLENRTALLAAEQPGKIRAAHGEIITADHSRANAVKTGSV
jgi:hypothetical protein